MLVSAVEMCGYTVLSTFMNLLITKYYIFFYFTQYIIAEITIHFNRFPSSSASCFNTWNMKNCFPWTVFHHEHIGIIKVY